MFLDQSRVKNKLFGFVHTTTKDGQQFRDRINQLIYYLRVFVEMIQKKKLVNKSLWPILRLYYMFGMSIPDAN